MDDTRSSNSPQHAIIMWLSRVEENSLEDVMFWGEVVISGIIELNGLFSVLEKSSTRLRLINHQLNIKYENLESI